MEKFDEFKKLVDEIFLDLQKNCAEESESRRYMAGEEYQTEVATRFRGVERGEDMRAVASSCAYCLYMLFE